MKKNLIDSINMAIGITIGTGLYHWIMNTESEYDFYRPLFVGFFSFILLFVYTYFKSKKKQ
ncbi:hypothetical protein [Paraglaciecola sp. L3A3]|uniref:hypothetical protein n=1 Tax=Paraglaciecola sp. L3A3 TaxID=2686358 RepID=UPI00131D0EBC|nr:hypothetical protein [Paraglaciecola sp. L3A3]